MTHGLTSREAVIAGESPAAYESYRADMLAALRPADTPEEDLVETMVMAQWKLRRLWRQERGVYADWQQNWENPDVNGTCAFINDCREEQAFTRLSRFEAHLTRAYLRAESRLRLLQDLRCKGLRQADADPAAASASSGTAIREKTIRGEGEHPKQPQGTDSTAGEAPAARITDSAPPDSA